MTVAVSRGQCARVRFGVDAPGLCIARRAAAEGIRT